MKPTRLHYFYARKWPVWLWMIFVPLLCAALMAGALGPPPDLFALDADARSYLFLLVLAWLLGWAGGAIAGSFILGPLYHHRAQLNGAPFQPGDRVEILVGRNRGRVVRVLESWDWRGMAKVDLAEPANAKRIGLFGSGDIFELTQLLKIAGDDERPAG